MEQAPERAGPSPEHLLQLAATVDKEVRRGKQFLDPRLNLTSLSRKVGTNRSYLSQVISFCFDTNFCAYLNELRIEEIMRYGTHVLHSEELLYDTALMCGFNNRRTFYRAFLREVGMLPSDFVAQYKRVSLQENNQP
jgi:AraC-like DNA-binding protein